MEGQALAEPGVQLGEGGVPSRQLGVPPSGEGQGHRSQHLSSALWWTDDSWPQAQLGELSRGPRASLGKPVTSDFQFPPRAYIHFSTILRDASSDGRNGKVWAFRKPASLGFLLRGHILQRQVVGTE